MEQVSQTVFVPCMQCNVLGFRNEAGLQTRGSWSSREVLPNLHKSLDGESSILLEIQHPHYQTFNESVKFWFHLKLLCLSFDFKACFSFRWNIATTLLWQSISDSLTRSMQQTNVPQAKHRVVFHSYPP